MNFVLERLGKWIEAAVLLTIGILCIVIGVKVGNAGVADIFSAQDEADAISLILGIVLIVVGALSLCLAILVGVLTKKSFATLALPGGLLLAFGVSLVVVKYAYGLINLLITIVPYLLIAIGAVVLLDVVFTFVLAVKAKDTKAALPAFICGAIVALTAIVLGALCIGNDPVIKQNVQLIVFGIILCLVAAFRVLVTFVKLPDTVVVIKKGE